MCVCVKKNPENQPLFLLSPLCVPKKLNRKSAIISCFSRVCVCVCVCVCIIFLSLFFLGLELHMICPTNHLCFVHFYFLNFSFCTLFWKFLQFHSYFLCLITVNIFQNIFHLGIILLSVEFPLNLFHNFYFSYHAMLHFTSVSTFIRFIIRLRFLATNSVISVMCDPVSILFSKLWAIIFSAL